MAPLRKLINALAPLLLLTIAILGMRGHKNIDWRQDTPPDALLYTPPATPPATPPHTKELDVQKALTEFHFYPKLPPDLRNLVWNFAFPSSRHLAYGMALKRPFNNYIPPPKFVKASEEAQEEFLRCYEPFPQVFMNSYENEYWTPKVCEPTYMDPSIDVVHMPVIALIKKLYGPKDIRNWAPDVPAENNLNKIDLRPLQKLETLEIQSNVDVDDDSFHFHEHSKNEVVDALEADNKGLAHYCKNLKNVRFVHGPPNEDRFTDTPPNDEVGKDWALLEPALDEYFSSKHDDNIIRHMPDFSFRNYDAFYRM